MPAPIRQPSHILPFCLSAFFLLAPIAILIFRATRAHSSPVEQYTRAVHHAAQPTASDISHSLYPVNFGKEITVVTWTKHTSVNGFRGSKKSPSVKETWVAVADNLRSFCRDYVKSQHPDRAQLTRRLEQRLGLPPDSGFDTFIELNLAPKDVSEFFRPCLDTAPTDNSCLPAFVPSCTNWDNRPENCLPRTALELSADLGVDAGGPKAAGSKSASNPPIATPTRPDPRKVQQARNRFWFLNTYYNRFALPNPYPWTSLGYTFDWATESGSSDFVQFGESEFVIPPNVDLQFVSATDTATYCAPQ